MATLPEESVVNAEQRFMEDSLREVDLSAPENHNFSTNIINPVSGIYEAKKRN